MAPLGSAAEEYAKTHKNIVFCNTKIKEFVVRCYDKILGRAPDEAGLLDWCGQIASGKKGGSAIVQASSAARNSLVRSTMMSRL